jgi:hypothetical protein
LHFIYRGVSDDVRRGSSRMGVRILASVTAVLGAAALTLACMIALVEGTIRAVSIDQIPLRVVVVAADLVLGTVLLLGASTWPRIWPFVSWAWGRPNFLRCRSTSIPVKFAPVIPLKFSGIVLRACAKVSKAVRHNAAH